MSIRLVKLTLELTAAGIPIDGVSGIGAQSSGAGNEPLFDDATINYLVSASPAQRTQGAAIKTAHDSGVPLGYVSAMTTGVKLIALIGTAGQAVSVTYYKLFICRAVNLTRAPTVSLGTNSPNYDNLLPATSLAGHVGGDIFTTVLSGWRTAILVPTPVYLNVSINAQGSAGAQALIGSIIQADTLILGA